MLQIKRLNAQAAGFREQLDALLALDAVLDSGVQTRVQDILASVQREGDAALLKYSEALDGLRVNNVAELEIPIAECREALQRLPTLEREALQAAAGRIRRHAEHQALQSWSYTEDDGTLLGQQVTPLARVGVYVPGGKACYPSSVLMNTLPAKVAGVPEVIMAVPAPGGVCNPWVLAAAAVAGVDRVFRLGGAQAIAALAYGTPTIPAVDKIVGPGNVYVATAKRMVFGKVGIDMLAGPSEILIICDGHTDPDWIAMDLFSQAEHDENAQSILISPDATFLDEVERRMQALLPSMTRQAIIREALNLRGGLIQTADLQEAVTWANYIAPEHLELSVAEPHSLLPLVKNAGAIFLGRYTSEALGDYCAGPNHVLPTARTARFTSPLGVYDFQKRSSIIQCTPESAAQLGSTASVLAQGEGLSAHARSAEYRQKGRNAG